MRRTKPHTLLSLEETALLLGIGRSTMYRAVRDGNVPFPVHRIGGYWYVPRAALQRFLNGELDGRGGSESLTHVTPPP
jgi:excisionase family DNA binding protein